MSFNVKITAIAAILLGSALFLQAPAASAKDGNDAKASDSKTEKTAGATKTTTKVVVVKPGDTLSSLANKYKTTWVRLYDANKGVINPDLIRPGQKIKVPTKSEKLPDRYNQYVSGQAAPAATGTYAYYAPATSYTAPANVSVVAGNAYDWGQCTWYVKNRRPDIGSFWGNAGYSWLSSARAAGFATGSAPRAGAVAVQAGHVAYVESVSGGNVRVSEMNWNGGVGIVSYRTAPSSTFSYIY